MPSRKLKKSQEKRLRKPYNIESIGKILHSGLEQGVFPGGVLEIRQGGEQVYAESCGTFLPENAEQVNPQVKQETVYDLGNLTSVIGTTSIITRLIDSGSLNLNDQVIRFKQNFSIHDKASITIGDLLFHISGLASSNAYYEELQRESSGDNLGIITSPGAKQYVYNRINRLTLKNKPQEYQVYSDLGMILLGSIIEEVCGIDLDQAVATHVLKPLAMENTGYVKLQQFFNTSLASVSETVAPTEQCSWRKKLLWGEAWDDNAWAMGGISGHAGLFSSTGDLSLFANEVIRSYHNNSHWLSNEVLSKLWALEEEPHGMRYVGGWEKPHAENALLDIGFTDHAVGFNSNTGCMLWIEPEKELSIVFLCNAVCPTRNNRKISPFRSMLLGTILECFNVR